MHQLFNVKCFVRQWMCQWFSEARAEKRAQRWWKAWLDLFPGIGVPNTRWFLRIQGRCSSHVFNYQGSPCSTNFSHLFNQCCHAAEQAALVNMYMGRAAQRKAHSPDHENEHWQLSSWMIERQDSADCQRFKVAEWIIIQWGFTAPYLAGLPFAELVGITELVGKRRGTI